MPRRVGHIDTHAQVEVIALMAARDDLIEGNYSSKTGRIRKFVKRFMKLRHELRGTDRLDMGHRRMANYFGYGCTRTVKRRTRRF